MSIKKFKVLAEPQSRTIKQNFKNLIFFAAVAQSTPQGCRSRGDQPPLSHPYLNQGADYANHITACPPPRIFTSYGSATA